MYYLFYSRSSKFGKSFKAGKNVCLNILNWYHILSDVNEYYVEYGILNLTQKFFILSLSANNTISNVYDMTKNDLSRTVNHFVIWV